MKEVERDSGDDGAGCVIYEILATVETKLLRVPAAHIRD